MIRPSTEQDYRERIVRTLVHIQRHLDEELELDDVAAVAAFSPFHFHRIFRGLVGESLGEHVRRLRLERAAGVLKRDDVPIVQIALQAGFETHESFTRAFTSMFGETPSTYRAAHRSGQGRQISGCQPPELGDIPSPEMRELAPMRLVFLRHMGPYGEVGATWGKLMMWAGMRGLLGPGMKMIGIVHDDPEVTPADKIRYDAAVAVTRPVEPQGDFGTMELPGGTYAVFTHRGPYAGLGKTYRAIYGGWLPTSGRQLRDTPAFEQYLNSPRDTRPEDLMTLIHVPVES
jgi:AraC family transcriptional regulator